MRIRFIPIIITASILLTSCATLFKGSTDSLNISSDPEGAEVIINGMKMGKTPLSLELKSDATYNIEFKKEGYESRNYILNSSVGGGWIVLDILGGLFPVVIDAATGNWYELDQEHVNMILDEEEK